jgi:hypothetical protein
VYEGDSVREKCAKSFPVAMCKKNMKLQIDLNASNTELKKLISGKTQDDFACAIGCITIQGLSHKISHFKNKIDVLIQRCDFSYCQCLLVGSNSYQVMRIHDKMRTLPMTPEQMLCFSSFDIDACISFMNSNCRSDVDLIADVEVLFGVKPRVQVLEKSLLRFCNTEEIFKICYLSSIITNDELFESEVTMGKMRMKDWFQSIISKDPRITTGLSVTTLRWMYSERVLISRFKNRANKMTHLAGYTFLPIWARSYALAFVKLSPAYDHLRLHMLMEMIDDSTENRFESINECLSIAKQIDITDCEEMKIEALFDSGMLHGNAVSSNDLLRKGLVDELKIFDKNIEDFRLNRDQDCSYTIRQVVDLQSAMNERVGRRGTMIQVAERSRIRSFEEKQEEEDEAPLMASVRAITSVPAFLPPSPVAPTTPAYNGFLPMTPIVASTPVNPVFNFSPIVTGDLEQVIQNSQE